MAKHAKVVKKTSGEKTKRSSATRKIGKGRKSAKPPAISKRVMRRRALQSVSQQDLAWVFGVSVQAVSKWLANGSPGRESGGYNLRAYHAWLKARAQPKDLKNDPAHRLKLAQARREEKRLAQELGELISKQEAVTRELKIIRWTVGVMNRAGAELASLVTGKRLGEVKRVVAKYFDERRREAVGDD